MNHYREENHCGCMEECSCTNIKEDHCYMKHHKRDKCEIPNQRFFDEKCPDRVKGFNLCKKRNELRCFKQCQPISQPCITTDPVAADFVNYFKNRTNFEFSGLVVVSNTGNPTSGCSMRIRVTDRAGTNVVATVYPGASIPIFVEGLVSIDIVCVSTETDPVVPATCSGEVIFDLEYCATKVCL